MSKICIKSADTFHILPKNNETSLNLTKGLGHVPPANAFPKRNFFKVSISKMFRSLREEKSAKNLKLEAVYYANEPE